MTKVGDNAFFLEIQSFFSLVVFTYLTFDFGSIYLQWMKSYVELALLP